MEIRQLTPDYAVSPQIDPVDLNAIAEAGFKTVLCNRPDAEIEPRLQAASMAAAAQEAGLNFVINPVVHTGMTEEIVALQRSTIESEGPVLAYCASGTRSTIVWMLGFATDTPVDDLMAAAARAGYQLEQLRPQLEGRAASA
ncbi:MAG: TIGR01244 family sulfur transferase [Pseudomonadota bacterium]